LLAQKLGGVANGEPVDFAKYELFDGLDAKQLATLKTLLERRTFARGEVIFPSGAPAGELYFLARGCASATMEQTQGAKKRLGTFSPGMSFGEMAMLDRAPRSAEVVADTDVECDLLKLEDFEGLAQTHPDIKLVLLRNVALRLSRNLRKRNQEFRVFDY